MDSKKKTLFKYLKSIKKVEAILLIEVVFHNNSGLKVAREITELYPNIKVVFFSQFDDHMTLMFSIRNGAKGFLNKNLSRDELIDSIKFIDEEKASFIYKKTNRY